ncbi:hypothetical protein IGI04_031044 [Brassica rapa subsp. trilocularis]|uniref:Site-specific DNA-methyltransferase (adenine-specific) n=1 Tax=Brassica rapa subsp. trilocularis TaxID=1813537 RepID=A0ABQ7LV34_BRACM|nr:hypothetical protein IGI04_031044 [Brassica rapa subsp. trilocularis]
MSFPLANKIEAKCWRIAQRIDEIMEIDMGVKGRYTRTKSPLQAEDEGLLWTMQVILKFGHREMVFQSTVNNWLYSFKRRKIGLRWTRSSTKYKLYPKNFFFFFFFEFSEFSELSIAYIPRSLKFCTNSLAKGVRSRASRSAFVNPFVTKLASPTS